MSVFALSLLLGALLQSGPYTPAVMPPADDAPKNPEFLLFRRRLLDSVESSDLKAIWAMTSSDVQASLSGSKGIPALRREWGVDRSPKAFLRELRTVLKLGGRLGACEFVFVAPYVFTDFSGG